MESRLLKFFSSYTEALVFLLSFLSLLNCLGLGEFRILFLELNVLAPKWMRWKFLKFVDLHPTHCIVHHFSFCAPPVYYPKKTNPIHYWLLQFWNLHEGARNIINIVRKTFSQVQMNFMFRINSPSSEKFSSDHDPDTLCSILVPCFSGILSSRIRSKFKNRIISLDGRSMISFNFTLRTFSLDPNFS